MMKTHVKPVSKLRPPRSSRREEAHILSEHRTLYGKHEPPHVGCYDFSNRLLILLTAILMGILAASTSAATVPGTDRPNVLFIMTDQQFSDAMSCRMGPQYLRTPAMDSLAAQGMVFTRAYSPNPLCMPARASIFTGRYPHETGVTINANVKVNPTEFVCMGTWFHQAGYATAYFGKWHLCYAAKDVSAHGFEIMKSKADKSLDRDARTANDAARFIAEKHAQPFLLVASFLNPHNICEYSRGQKLPCGPIGEAPPLEQCPPAPANLAPPLGESDCLTLLRRACHAHRLFPVGDFTADQWRRQRWGYYRMIEEVDAEIGKILAALRAAHLEDNTLIIFTSDHGECAGAHGFNQKTVFYEESVRVPLIVSWSGHTRQATSDHLVNTGLDILPTMLDFTGLAIPKKLTGRSLRPLALGQPVTAWREYVVSENHLVQTGVVDGFQPTAQGRMLRTERYKYCIYDSGIQRESLVDLQQDPGETRNLATNPAYRDVLLKHRALLTRFATDHHDPLAAEMLADDVAPRPFAR